MLGASFLYLSCYLLAEGSVTAITGIPYLKIFLLDGIKMRVLFKKVALLSDTKQLVLGYTAAFTSSCADSGAKPLSRAGLIEQHCRNHLVEASTWITAATWWVGPHAPPGLDVCAVWQGLPAAAQRMRLQSLRFGYAALLSAAWPAAGQRSWRASVSAATVPSARGSTGGVAKQC